MNSLKMAGVDLRSIVKTDEPDLVFLDGASAAVMLQDLKFLESTQQRQYTYWLMTVDPIEFLSTDFLSKPFFHPSLITETFEPKLSPSFASFHINYEWGWMVIDFIDHSRYPYPFTDDTDTWIANPDIFTREQKLFSIEVTIEPARMPGFIRRSAEAGNTSIAERLIDMDLIEIALKHKDAFFYGMHDNQQRGFWRPGMHIKRFENAGDTWVFFSELSTAVGLPFGDNSFFALRQRLPQVKTIYALGNDVPDIPSPPLFSGSYLEPFACTDELYIGDFPLFRGRNPMDLFQPKTTD